MSEEHGRDSAKHVGGGANGVKHQDDNKGGDDLKGYCVIGHVVMPVADFPATARADTLNNTGKAPTWAERQKFQELNYLTSDADGMGHTKVDS